MLNNGTLTYIIAGITAYGNLFWTGTFTNGKPDFSSALQDAKRYDDTDLLRDDLENKLHKFPMSYKIIEIQKCPKCHKEYADYPAISREDNATEICPECGVREAVEVLEASKNLC